MTYTMQEWFILKLADSSNALKNLWCVSIILLLCMHTASYHESTLNFPDLQPPSGVMYKLDSCTERGLRPFAQLGTGKSLEFDQVVMISGAKV